MGKTIHISVPHHRTPEDVRARLEKGLADFRASPMSKMATLQESWEGQTLNLKASVMAQSVTARVEPRPNSVEIDIDLPWAFAMLAGKIQKEVEEKGRLLLEDQKPK